MPAFSQGAMSGNVASCNLHIADKPNPQTRQQECSTAKFDFRRSVYEMGDEFETGDDGTWVSALEGALLEPCSLQDLRLLCRGHIIPEPLRVQVWQRLLGSTKNSISNGIENFGEIFDLKNQSQLRDDCGTLVEKLQNDESEKVSILSDIESLITHFCKSRHTEYKTDNGMLDLIKPLISLKLPKNELFNLFCSVKESYIPRSSQPNGAAMHLFRLLLLYHEPELCSFLDSHKLAPNTYISQWFTSLFAGTCNLPATLALWDYYFVRGDPFLLFFLALVLLINGKEDIMGLKGQKDEIISTIGSLPSMMEAADVHDFFSLAVLYSAQTPISYKREYHECLFAEGDFEGNLLELSQALCLPVSVQELLVSCKLLNQPLCEDVETRTLRFFLVDCRPADQYNAGHLPTAFHLDSNLMLTEPQAFSVAVQALLSAQKQSIAAQSAAGGEHLVFLGSGREEEDQYLHMVVAFFLQRNVQFVSLVQGGFQSVHQALSAAQNENFGSLNDLSEPIGLVEHDPSVCLVCSQSRKSAGPLTAGSSSKANKGAIKELGKTSQTPESTSTQKSDFFERMRSKSALVKDKLFDYIVNPSSSPGSTAEQSPSNSKTGSASKSKGSGKLYRNLAPVFSIDDDQDEKDDTTYEGALENEADAPQHELMPISSMLKRPDVISSFRCHELKESGHAFPSYLLITATHLYALREIQDRPGFARLSVNRSLGSIMRITSKKRHPEFITIKYGNMNEDETVIVDLDRFIIPQAGDAVKLIKLQLNNSLASND